jgi:hypothetical protein
METGRYIGRYITGGRSKVAVRLYPQLGYRPDDPSSIPGLGPRLLKARHDVKFIQTNDIITTVNKYYNIIYE